jgi:hypothetical protein
MTLRMYEYILHDPRNLLVVSLKLLGCETLPVEVLVQ